MHSSSALHTVLVHAVMQVPQMKTVTFCQASAHAVSIQMGGTARSVWVTPSTFRILIQMAASHASVLDRVTIAQVH